MQTAAPPKAGHRGIFYWSMIALCVVGAIMTGFLIYRYNDTRAQRESDAFASARAQASAGKRRCRRHRRPICQHHEHCGAALR